MTITVVRALLHLGSSFEIAVGCALSRMHREIQAVVLADILCVKFDALAYVWLITRTKLNVLGLFLL